jgi:hypothetical protein
VQYATVPVSPLHHRSDGETAGIRKAARDSVLGAWNCACHC